MEGEDRNRSINLKEVVMLRFFLWPVSGVHNVVMKVELMPTDSRQG